LDKVVTERIFDETVKIVDNNISKGKLLSLPSLLQTSLHYAASVLMRTDFYAVKNASVENKLGEALKLLAPLAIRLFRILRSFEDAEKCLNHVVSVCTLQR
jgi:hypothetical protein